MLFFGPARRGAAAGVAAAGVATPPRGAALAFTELLGTATTFSGAAGFSLCTAGD